LNELSSLTEESGLWTDLHRRRIDTLDPGDGDDQRRRCTLEGIMQRDMAHRHRFAASVGCLSAALAASLGLAPGVAQAENFHGYSVARETGYTNKYVGLAIRRLDKHVEQARSGCSEFYSGDPVYQTQWVIVTSDARNWLELGTGHQCEDELRYWFWGWGTNGVWHPLGERSGITNGVEHRFAITRSDGRLWDYNIDGDTKVTLSYDDQGARIETGLESYGPNAAISEYTHNTLSYRLIGADHWTDWSGYDDSVIVGPVMCGGWNSATSWRASENRPC